MTIEKLTEDRGLKSDEVLLNKLSEDVLQEVIPLDNAEIRSGQETNTGLDGTSNRVNDALSRLNERVPEPVDISFGSWSTDSFAQPEAQRKAQAAAGIFVTEGTKMQSVDEIARGLLEHGRICIGKESFGRIDLNRWIMDGQVPKSILQEMEIQISNLEVQIQAGATESDVEGVRKQAVALKEMRHEMTLGANSRSAQIDFLEGLRSIYRESESVVRSMNYDGSSKDLAFHETRGRSLSAGLAFGAVGIGILLLGAKALFKSDSKAVQRGEHVKLH